MMFGLGHLGYIGGVGIELPPIPPIPTPFPPWWWNDGIPNLLPQPLPREAPLTITNAWKQQQLKNALYAKRLRSTPVMNGRNVMREVMQSTYNAEALNPLRLKHIIKYTYNIPAIGAGPVPRGGGTRPVPISYAPKPKPFTIGVSVIGGIDYIPKG